jgi:septum formation inhibitor MinC
VHAGADGNQQARIMAMELKPTQMKISGVVSTQILQKSKSQPEMALLKENEIIIEPWNGRK